PPVTSVLVPGANPKIAVDTQPSGAVVKIDGKDAGKTPTTLEVSPDVEHSIDVVANGYDVRSEKVKLARGEMKPFLWMLAQKKARLKVTAAIKCEVSVDGKSVGFTPVDIPDLAPGVAHSVAGSYAKGKDAF